jgi:hypothetical protein
VWRGASGWRGLDSWAQLLLRGLIADAQWCCYVVRLRRWWLEWERGEAVFAAYYSQQAAACWRGMVRRAGGGAAAAPCMRFCRWCTCDTFDTGVCVCVDCRV